MCGLRGPVPLHSVLHPRALRTQLQLGGVSAGGVRCPCPSEGAVSLPLRHGGALESPGKRGFFQLPPGMTWEWL